MKWTTVSIGGLAAAALLAVALWPDGANLKLTPKAIAQAAKPTEADPVAADTPEKRDVVKTKDDNNAATEAALAKQVAAEFIDTPLADVIAYLQDLTGVEFYFNAKKLEEEGVAKDAPITLQLKKVRVDMMLDLALAQAGDGVAYVVRDGIVIISSAANLENATEVRVYNCRDLLKLSPTVETGLGTRVPVMMPKPMPVPALPGVPGTSGAPSIAPVPGKPLVPGSAPAPGAGPPGSGALGEPAAVPATPTSGAPTPVQPQVGNHSGMGGFAGGGPAVPLDESSQRAERLMHIITTAVAPDSWQEMGGFGTVAEYSGLLVVNHNAKTHRQIEKVLTMLREAVAKDAEAMRGQATGRH